MIYKIVAVIGVIFLIIFALVVYSALTLPAKTLVRVNSTSTQQAITAQTADFALLPVTRKSVQLRFTPQESFLISEDCALIGEAPINCEAAPQAFSGQLTYTRLQIPPFTRVLNGSSTLNSTNRV